MMEQIGQYILSLTAAAVISTLAIRLLGKNGASSAIVKLIVGVFMTITVISPWTKLQFHDLTEYINGLNASADPMISDGKIMASDSFRASIKTGTESYILDKASSMGLTLQIDVSVSDDEIPRPVSLTVYGTVSPYAKRTLQEIIARDLGIPEEDQIWN